MKINPPKKVTFWVSIFAFVIGFLLALNIVPSAPIVAVIGFILTGLSYLLLVLGLLVKGL